MKKILSIFLLAFSGLVQAACPNFVDGTVLTSAALNSAFAAPCITGGSVPYSVLTGTVPIWNQSTTGNAATATTATNQSGGSVSATSIANSGSYTQTGTAANTFSGLVSANSGQFTGAVTPASGVGVEILDTGVTGRVQSYDRSNSVFTPLDLDASALTLSINSVSVMTVGSSGASISGSLSSTGAITSNSISNSGSYTQNGKLLLSSIAPTIASGFGTTPSIVNSNGTASFAVNVVLAALHPAEL